MFNFGISEIGLIALLALVVLGPKRLPEAARTAGRWLAKLRGFINGVKQDLDRELHAEELAELRRLKEALQQTRHAIESTSADMLQDITRDDTLDGAAATDSADEPDYMLDAMQDSANRIHPAAIDSTAKPQKKASAKSKPRSKAKAKAKKSSAKKTPARAKRNVAVNKVTSAHKKNPA